MNIFGGSSSHGGQLEQLMASIGEDIDERALVQYYEPDAKGPPFWALVLLTAGNLHIIYGESMNWLSKLTQSGQPTLHLESVRLESIERVNVPERGGLWTRLVRGPTRTVEIECRDRVNLRFEIDSEADAFFEALRARIR